MQASIAKGVEEKMSSDQRKYMLNEQLRAIKKVGVYSLKSSLNDGQWVQPARTVVSWRKPKSRPLAIFNVTSAHGL